MPALAVALNDESLATVSSDGLNLVDVRISGDRIGPELGIIRVTGGAYEDGAAKQLDLGGRARVGRGRYRERRIP